MVEGSDTRWLDVINLIDREGEKAATQLRLEESLRKKAYHNIIKEDCEGRKHHRLKELVQKHRERESVDRDVMVLVEYKAGRTKLPLGATTRTHAIRKKIRRGQQETV